MCDCKGNNKSCQGCRFWTSDNSQTKTKWGTCGYYTDNPGEPMKFYTGNWKTEGGTTKTTSVTRCPNYEA